MKEMKCFREDYPRVQFFRDSYMNLDGKWDFILDYDNQGENLGYPKGFHADYEILVPFAYNCEASLVNIQKKCDSVWYQRTIHILPENLDYDIFLHLEGSDYLTTLYVNGYRVDQQRGCTYRQSYDITSFVHSGVNLIIIHCEDSFSKEQVRGKQRWKDQNFECYYEETTGIYKTIWLEYAPKTRIEDLKIDPDFHEKSVSFNVSVSGVTSNLKLQVQIHLENQLVSHTEYKIEGNAQKMKISLEDNFSVWDVLSPSLYDVTVRLYSQEEIKDEILSYFGVRSIKIKDSYIYLNDRKLYQRLLLDQGYWRKSGYTAPYVEALLSDIKMMIQMGFNGARKHQKIEDERYLYYADVLGFLVWGEMPSMYENTIKSRQQFIEEWKKAVHQQYNHPSIIVWTPFNESWGIESIKTDAVQQDFVNQVYAITKELDPNRPVISNDGWEHTTSDILTLHHYEQDGLKLHSYYDSVEKIISGIWPAHHKGAYADGYTYQGQPILISEFGGCAFTKDIVGASWGYGKSVETEDLFLKRFEELIDSITSIPFICGYCYTQLSDVSQEVNGLLDADHNFKFDPSKLASIQSK
ncbi:MAG: glycoside hydrolase family 2 [Anaeroplasmataceae bacterium]|nr:glycoside hydrolase family 2 [Anaeroplasmataceae bacterium]